MNTHAHKIKGFTLIEIAIVLIVLTILLGYTMAMVPAQQELKQYRQADKEMDKILDALYAYAQVNGRLPCPDDMTSHDGEADPEDGLSDCTQWYGYVPSKTLGLEGNLINGEFAIRDPWGTPYRYQVTPSDTGSDTGGDFVMDGDIHDVGMAALAPDLVICTTNSNVNTEDANCGSNPTIADKIPAVILSLGKDRGRVASGIQKENTDALLDINSDGNFDDRVFVSATRSDASGAEFDDVVKWIVPNILYSKMIDAKKLP
jgi:prepilin-type N-terminal cleavage/methylation domain-containing protein